MDPPGRNRNGPTEGRGRAYLPREMDLVSLIGALVSEHETMKDGLRRANEAADRKDFGALSGTLKELDPIFRQHIVDEESQVLRLLIGSLGVEGAREEIKVFQQHRPIYRLMQKVAELASKSASELEKETPRLEQLFAEHAQAEESRVFPRAVSCLEGAPGDARLSHDTKGR